MSCSRSPSAILKSSLILSKYKPNRAIVAPNHVPEPVLCPKNNPIKGTKFTIAISSAKGGVGKSTFAMNFALALKFINLKVGILDADIYGPSLPKMMSINEKPKSENGKSLIKNPYTNWNQINKNLPNRKIVIYGPPKSSGTRDAFEDMVLKHTCKKIKAYTNMYKKDKKKYRKYKRLTEEQKEIIYKMFKEKNRTYTNSSIVVFLQKRLKIS